MKGYTVEDFKVGDVVRLKSGGPNMTIEMDAESNYESKGQIRCVWFDGKKKLMDDFVPATLTKADQSPISFGVV